MSLIRINVTDRTTLLTGELHASFCDRLIASLSAEPSTIAELEHAFTRFTDDPDNLNPLSWLSRFDFDDPLEVSKSLGYEPFDAGLMNIDLIGKTVGGCSTYSTFDPEGSVTIKDEEAEQPEMREFPLPYRVSSEWLFLNSVEEYRRAEFGRRKARLEETPIDVRSVIYGQTLFDFLASRLLKLDSDPTGDETRKIHKDWLLAPLSELAGDTPRQALLRQRDFIDFDLHARSLQWSFLKSPPAEIPEESVGYRFAGFGTHENVVYYDFVRHLICEAFPIWLREDAGSRPSLDAHFSTSITEWLSAENPEYSNRTPAMIIDYERRRKNIVLNPSECIIDENCPICMEMAAMFDTPMFWFLDGSHCDDEFVFSPFGTEDEWDQYQKRIEGFMANYEAAAGAD
ncbi:MAG: hypothetical protein R2684_03380 [Pyrinomonadaceae bacterium]